MHASLTAAGTNFLYVLYYIQTCTLCAFHLRFKTRRANFPASTSYSRNAGLFLIVSNTLIM